MLYRMKTAHNIATILPPSEHFTPAAAGAIALFVRDTTMGSVFQKNVTVYGNDTDKQRHFQNIAYQGVAPKMRLLYGRNGGFAQALGDEFRRNPPSLIEVHNRVNIFNILASHMPQSLITLYFHNDPLTIKGAMTPKERWGLLARADAIYCCSDYVRRRFLTGLEAGRTEHVHVVYEYTDLKPRHKKENIILYVGRLIEEKGVRELAQAAQRLLPHFPDWRIVFAGANRPGGKNDTAYAREVGRILKPLGKQAIFLGHQPHPKIMNLFARAAIAVVPSTWSEPMGRTAVEGIASGCALVTSGHGGLAEIAGEAGILASPVTPDGLALALQGLMEDPETLRQVQNLCYQHAAHFDLKAGRAYFDALRERMLNKSYNQPQRFY
ncbi:MAG: glycosyltransferase [Alphaproteobacteria bacterium]|nr:glycosyltransferase [Alphaproteobacteria bacterium]